MGGPLNAPRNIFWGVVWFLRYVLIIGHSDYPMALKIPFLQGRGTCIFCERRPPEVKMSKEHIFADWLRDCFHRDATTTHTFGQITWPVADPTLSEPHVRTKIGQGHSGSKKIRSVCEPCNNGWMSTHIEEVAKPILIPLMASQVMMLRTDMQRILATWAAKTAMVADHLDRQHSVIQQHERTWLMNHLSPPAGWYVWVASYNGTAFRELAIFQHEGALEIPGINNGTPTPHNLELTTIGMADALFLIMNSTWDRLWDILERIVGTSGAGFCRLWPKAEEVISWPRWTILGDEEARYFTTYLARVFEQRVEASTHTT